MRAVLAFLLVLSSLVVGIRTARAESTKSAAFALIVTNNRSPRLARPDLRYADDDGAKYYEVFRMIAPESNVALLTRFDRDTARLFPHLAGKERPPSKVALQAVARDLAVKMRKTDGPVDFYFVFAGHGDVDRGKGFLELEDGAFTSDDLEDLLKSMPAARSHVILDSCNSFFVVNARKPGGTHFVTSAEATKTLSERLPNVGVFLSTSAEASVYEWSELQSGVFSHAVRSGLAGGADVDGDGRVSYDELRAFVNVASAEIKNPNFRPQVLARGPGGRGREPLFDLNSAHAARLRLDEPRQRVTVRDANEIDWVDTHKEAGAGLTLRVPFEVAKGANIEELTADSSLPVRRRRWPSSEEGAEGETLLAALPVSEPPAETRGPDEVFRVLFARPFGKTSFERDLKEALAAEPSVLGISSDDARRMHDMLEQTATQARIRRKIAGLTMAGLGSILTAGGVYAYTQSKTQPEHALAIGLGVVGAASLTSGLVATFVTSEEEDIFSDYKSGLRQAKNPLDVVARTERRLFAVAEEYRRFRLLMRTVGIGVGALSLAVGTFRVARAEDSGARLGNGMFFGSLAALMGAVVGWSFVKYPTEETASMWSRDPGLSRLRSEAKIVLQPDIGLGTIGLRATF